ncbi:MAG: helix-turn-helix transcriptional regulator [Clostridia bacterium]|nr:helix-turn-helix transcriptional regulator [Clostridia bacterium]
MTIGERIKYFRTEKGITQEKIATELYISYQAVSKWERNETLPDVTAISKLAEVLGVSCDALLTDNKISTLNEINRIIEESKNKNISDKIVLLEKAVERYPNNENIIMELIQAYSMATELSDYHKYRESLINYGEYILKYSNNLQYKYDATQILCYIYRDLKNYERIEALANNMPRLEQCQEALLYHSMVGDDYILGVKEYAKKLLDTLESLSLIFFDKSLENDFEVIRKRILSNT